MAQSRVEFYNSDTDSIDNATRSSTRSKQNRKKWIPIANYSTKEEAMMKLKNDGFWSIKITNNTSEGKSVYYRCNKVKRRGDQCPASLHLLYHSENETVSMFSTADEHQHDGAISSGINEITGRN